VRTLATSRPAIALFVAILLFGAGIRLAAPTISPPGVNVDEAANAWNAYCILKTGMDQHGVTFPIFAARVFGAVDNRSTLFIYYAIPFLAFRGFNIEGIRMAGAFAGVLALLGIYYVGSRLFGRATGLLAMALMAVMPRTLQVTRWGQESSLILATVLAPFAALIWAGFPVGLQAPESRPDRPIPVHRAVIAGLVCGGCCYGYWGVRFFLPIVLGCTVLVNLRAWRRCDKRALATLSLVFVALFLPLVWKHVSDPEMNGRGALLSIWKPSDSLSVKIGKALDRYPAHFGSGFLFEQGDQFPWHTPPEGYGELLLFMAPMMIAGIVLAARHWKASPAARVLLVWLVIYPIGDLTAMHPGPHALRGLPGLCAMILLAAWGTVSTVSLVWRANRLLGWLLAGIIASGSVAMTGFFLHDYFTAFNREERVWRGYQPDMLLAMEWLRPRLSEVDAVYITSSAIPHPYMYALLGLRYEPEDWFRDRKDMRVGPMPNGNHPREEVFTRVGKLRFLYGEPIARELHELRADGNTGHVVFIVRPYEIPGLSLKVEPSAVFRSPQGLPTLQILEVGLR
jgi:hypothetical protein